MAVLRVEALDELVEIRAFQRLLFQSEVRLPDCEETQGKQQTKLQDHGRRLGALEKLKLDELVEDFAL